MGNKKASVKWASDDDAGDLLAGILSETEDDALLEQERIEAEIRAREAEEKRRKEEEELRKRAEADARISAEHERQEQVKKRRTQKIEALKIEELKESGQWKPPEEEIVPQPVQAAPVAQTAPVPVAAARPSHYVDEPEPQKSNSKGLAILGVIIALIVVAAGAVVALAGGGYEPDTTPYTKAVYSPKDSQTLLVEMAFAPIPKAEPKVEEPAPAARRRPVRRAAPRPAAAASSAPAKTTTSKKKQKALEGLDLDFDPFGGGH
ncbi:MAG: hypothetical protein ACNA8W_13630 [Bradymonadaceae bacterium]